MKSVAILYICTGRYVDFWPDFFRSVERNFLTNHIITYYVFTDFPESKFSPRNDRVNVIYQARLGWPKDTLFRGHIFIKYWDLISRHDYVYFMNANLIINEKIGEEIFPDDDSQMVVCLHPGQYRKNIYSYTYDRNPNSEAYIEYGLGTYYFAGGLNGGCVATYYKFISSLVGWIDKDYANNIVPVWHDESYLNKYLILYRSYKILDPSYLYPEGSGGAFPKRIIIRDKKKVGGHSYLRNISGRPTKSRVDQFEASRIFMLMIKFIYKFLQISTLFAICLIPFAVVSIFIFFSSRGPILHWSHCVGLGNKVFRMPMFRIYKIDYSRGLPEFLSAGNELTCLGGVLSKLGFDKIPQIWCILTGDMKLVGIRPALSSNEKLIEKRTRSGLHVLTPGIINLFELNENNIDSIDLDLFYFKNKGFMLEFKIVILTILKFFGIRKALF